MKKYLILATLLLAPLAMAQGTGPYKFLVMTQVSKLPAAGPATNQMWVVTDGTTTSDCSTGGGTDAVICQSNGSSWSAITGGGGGSWPGYPGSGIVISTGSAWGTSLPAPWISAATQSGSDDCAKVNAAITSLSGTGGTVDARGFAAGNATVSTTCGASYSGSSMARVTVLFNPGTIFIPSSGSVNLLEVRTGMDVQGFSANTTGVSYTGTAILFPDNYGIEEGTPNQYQIYTGLHNFNLMGTTGQGVGLEIEPPASGGAAFVDIGSGQITGYQQGIYFDNANSNSFINANTVSNVSDSNSTYCVTLTEPSSGLAAGVSGNQFANDNCEGSGSTTYSTTALTLAYTNGNLFTNFSAWDYSGSGQSVTSLSHTSGDSWVSGFGAPSTMPLTQNTSGNAATATNLSSYPTLCSGGQFSQGLSSGSNNCATPSGGGGYSPTMFQSSATNTNIGSTSLVSSTSGTPGLYTLKWEISLTSAGVACTGSTTVILNDIFTDPATSTAVTNPIGTIMIASNGVGTVGYIANGQESILSKNATSISYSTSSYSEGTACTTAPTYQVSGSIIYEGQP